MHTYTLFIFVPLMQVATRFLSASCPPVYWFAAQLMLSGRGSGAGGSSGAGSGSCAGNAGVGPEKGSGRNSGAGRSGSVGDSSGGAGCGAAGSSGTGKGAGVVISGAAGGGLSTGLKLGGASGGARVWWGRQGDGIGSSSSRYGGCCVRGGWWALALWSYCLVYLGLGAVMFPNFYPWT